MNSLQNVDSRAVNVNSNPISCRTSRAESASADPSAEQTTQKLIYFVGREKMERKEKRDDGN